MLNYAKKVGSYIHSEASRYYMEITKGEIDERIETCKACEHLKVLDAVAPCIGYCSKCECAAWSRSEMTVKATMPAATCPKQKWVKLRVLERERVKPTIDPRPPQS